MKTNSHHACPFPLCLILGVIGAFFFPFAGFSQPHERVEKLAAQLDSLSLIIPGLNEKTTLSMREISLAEYVRAVGMEHRVSVFIEDTPGIVLTTHLTDEPVKSVFLFVCKHFSYTIQPTGSILVFFPWEEPTSEPEKPIPKLPIIRFSEGKLSCDLKNDSIYPVLKMLSTLTGRKLITRPGTEGLLTAFLPPTHPDTALEAIFIANGFKISNSRKGFQVVQSVENLLHTTRPGNADFSIEAFTDADQEYLALEAVEADLETLIREIFEELDSDYLIYERLEGRVTLHAEITRLDDILKYLLQGTPYTFKREGKLYLIGTREQPGLNTTRVVTMRYRPTFQAMDLIPGAEPGAGEMIQPPVIRQTFPARQQTYPENNYGGEQSTGLFSPGLSIPETHTTPPQISRIKAGEVEIIEYPELNRLILKGPVEQVDEIEKFLEEIDRPVPMVKVEMIVVEINKNRLTNTGIRAGLGDTGDSSLVKNLFPGIDFSATGEEINNLLSNIPGLSPIGVLDENFHLRLHALETRGNVKVRMKPVLSMLNGREASLTIGQTQYFLLETQTASTGAVSNFQQFTQRFERIDANVTLSIRPYISEGEMVTLDVIPDFTTPVGSFDADIPPTISTRRFISSIRVKNGETVILGGLSQEESRENTEGLPLLSRIPVLKWLFGNVDKNKSESSLIIYLTPTIQYQ
ncbi:MAG: hypothetical protein SF052_14320 [Bacteroidia bacterium]|nr:hypothetical protein [Bacteroidia bacterium]